MNQAAEKPVRNAHGSWDDRRELFYPRSDRAHTNPKCERGMAALTAGPPIASLTLRVGVTGLHDSGTLG